MDQNLLETPRLALRPLTFEAIAGCVEIDADPVVMRFVGGPASRWTRPHWLAQRLAEGWPRRGGFWLVHGRTGGRLLGWCGLFPLPLRSPHAPPLFEIGYRYFAHAWGRGVATEAGRRVIAHGFAHLGHDQIAGVTHPENHASQRVLTKLGLRREGECDVYGLTLPFFRLGRRAWAAQAAAGAPADL
ncbi:MAG: GNAT family N-acetyltransferase [Alphaproteobacteria bacterium]